MENKLLPLKPLPDQGTDLARQVERTANTDHGALFAGPADRFRHGLTDVRQGDRPGPVLLRQNGREFSNQPACLKSSGIGRLGGDHVGNGVGRILQEGFGHIPVFLVF